MSTKNIYYEFGGFHISDTKQYINYLLSSSTTSCTKHYSPNGDLIIEVNGNDHMQY